MNAAVEDSETPARIGVAAEVQRRILVAGIGNIFEGDDGFGVAVLQKLRELTPGAEEASNQPHPRVELRDFGIRGHDLAYAIADGYDAVILVDAMARGEEPGTLFLLELDLQKLDGLNAAINGHSLNPVGVLQMVRGLGSYPSRILLLGCEPASLSDEDGLMSLSPAVAAAIPGAVRMIRDLLKDLPPPDNPEPVVHAARKTVPV